MGGTQPWSEDAGEDRFRHPVEPGRAEGGGRARRRQSWRQSASDRSAALRSQFFSSEASQPRLKIAHGVNDHGATLLEVFTQSVNTAGALTEQHAREQLLRFGAECGRDEMRPGDA